MTLANVVPPVALNPKLLKEARRSKRRKTKSLRRTKSCRKNWRRLLLTTKCLLLLLRIHPLACHSTTIAAQSQSCPHRPSRALTDPVVPSPTHHKAQDTRRVALTYASALCLACPSPFWPSSSPSARRRRHRCCCATLAERPREPHGLWQGEWDQ